EQMSGEDWTNVSMTLSTATPSLVAKAPVLEPLTIALSAGGQGQGGGGKGSAAAYFSEKQQLETKRRMVEQNRNFSFNNANTFTGNTTINGGTLNLAGNAVNVQPNQPAAQQQPGNPSDVQQQLAQTEDFDVTLNDVAREPQALDLVNSAKVERSGKP